MIEEILIQYNDSDTALFGPDNAEEERIDTAASRAKFAEMLWKEIEAKYPSAIIKIQTSKHGICEAWRTDGRTDQRTLYIIHEILRETWASFNWLVDADVR